MVSVCVRPPAFICYSLTAHNTTGQACAILLSCYYNYYAHTTQKRIDRARFFTDDTHDNIISRRRRGWPDVISAVEKHARVPNRKRWGKKHLARDRCEISEFARFPITILFYYSAIDISPHNDAVQYLIRYRQYGRCMYVWVYTSYDFIYLNILWIFFIHKTSSCARRQMIYIIFGARALSTPVIARVPFVRSLFFAA